jgi:hypothetical protein
VLLTIDVGNTQTVHGPFEGEEIVDHWQVATDPRRTGSYLGRLVTVGTMLLTLAVTGCAGGTPGQALGLGQRRLSDAQLTSGTSSRSPKSSGSQMTSDKAP